MINPNIPTQVIVNDGGSGSSGTGFEASNATYDVSDELDQDTLDFLSLAGFNPYSEAGYGNNNSFNNSQVVNDPQINEFDNLESSPLYQESDDDTKAFLELAGLQNAGMAPDTSYVNNQVSNNSASTKSEDDTYKKLSQNKFDFTELMNLYNESLAKQYEFNAQEAQKDREWQKMMSDTAYQRAFEDMKKAGLNPLVALGQLGAASTPGGASASGSYGSISPLSSALTQYLGQNKNMATDILGTIGKLISTIAMFFI